MSPGKLVTHISIILFLSFQLTGQELQFYREDILFKVTENAMLTDATYYFCNVGAKDIRTSLFYPFPENTIALIDSIVVAESGFDSTIPFRMADAGIFFEISVKSYGQSAYRVYFRQRLTEGCFRYILKSTAAWGRSLEYANYEMQVPVSTTVETFTYPPDTTYISTDNKTYLWKKTDFMPDRDFEVFFHSK